MIHLGFVGFWTSFRSLVSSWPTVRRGIWLVHADGGNKWRQFCVSREITVKGHSLRRFNWTSKLKNSGRPNKWGQVASGRIRREWRQRIAVLLSYFGSELGQLRGNFIGASRFKWVQEWVHLKWSVSAGRARQENEWFRRSQKEIRMLVMFFVDEFRNKWSLTKTKAKNGQEIRDRSKPVASRAIVIRKVANSP